MEPYSLPGQTKKIYLIFVLFSFLAAFGQGNHLSAKGKTRDTGRVSYSQCQIGEGDRKECGFYGIDREGCAARDCCWIESDVPGTPWCYLSRELSTPQCLAVSDPRKVDCGYYGIDKTECVDNDCCWIPAQDPYAPWCFNPATDVGPGDGGGDSGVGPSGRCGAPSILPREYRMSFDDDGSEFSRIVGGAEVRPHSWPWQVSVQRGDFHFCGGSLIAPQWVVSAAHCEMGSSELFVVLGEHHLEEEEPSQTRVRVEMEIPHELYGQGANDMDHDIMLLKLAEPVTYTQEIQPVCLPQQGQEPEIGATCTTTGWGTTSSGGRSPDELRQVAVPILSVDTCNQPDWYDGLITHNMVCAGLEEGGKDACQGDSGGPFVCKEGDSWVLTGVVSWGFGCAGALKPGLYANTANYVDWIEEQMARHS